MDALGCYIMFLLTFWIWKHIIKVIELYIWPSSSWNFAMKIRPGETLSIHIQAYQQKGSRNGHLDDRNQG